MGISLHLVKKKVINHPKASNYSMHLEEQGSAAGNAKRVFNRLTRVDRERER